MRNLILTAVLLISVMASAQDLGKYSDMILEHLNYINEARIKEGATPLKLDQTLVEGAKIRVKELKKQFSHTRPNGKNFNTVIDYKDACGLINFGENAAKGCYSAKDAFQNLWGSKGHRKNMMSVAYNIVGIYYNPKIGGWIQIFARDNRQ